MPRIGTRSRFIIHKTSRTVHVDPAQNGAYTARLTGTDLALTGIRNQKFLHAEGVLAARWENEETLLLVIREEEEDEPTVVRAFKPRIHREWETEDAHGTAHPSQATSLIAVVFALPNHKIAVIAQGKVVRDYEISSNLGAAPEFVAWSENGLTLTVTCPDLILMWTVGAKTFKKTARKRESGEEQLPT